MRAMLDTNIACDSDLLHITKRVGVDIAFVSVSSREVERSSYVDAVAQEVSIVETLVMGESIMGQAALGREAEAPCLERVLKVITAGSFPPKGQRDDLSKGERRQLRDAMIFCEHVRAGRDWFVTHDLKAFVCKVSAQEVRKCACAIAPRIAVA